jgi:uncharacterized DUF497 family protein
MTFEWDEAKSQWTKENRGFDFDYASTVFLDENRVNGLAKEKDKEVRHYVIGKAAFGEILFVVFTWRRHNKNEQICHILSARIAHKTERIRYPQVR